MNKIKTFSFVLLLTFVFILNISYFKNIFAYITLENRKENDVVSYIEKNLEELVNSGNADNGFIVIFNNKNKLVINGEGEKIAETKVITKVGTKKIENFIIIDKSMDYIIVNKCFINSFVEDELNITEKELGKKMTRLLIRCPLILNDKDNIVGYYGISKNVNILDIERTVSNFNNINLKILELIRK